jgi:hypothetical protein
MNLRAATRGLWVAGAVARSLARSVTPGTPGAPSEDPDPIVADQDGNGLAPPPAEHPRPPVSRWKVATSAVIIALVLAAVGFAQTHAGRHVTSSLGVGAPRQAFTAIYFTAPGTVGSEPLQARRGIAFATVSFWIANHTHGPMSYRWSIRATRQTPVATGINGARAGHAALVNQVIAVRCSSRHVAGRRGRVPSRFRIRVAVNSNPPESISYWETCVG